MKEKYEFDKYLEKVMSMKGRPRGDFKRRTLSDYCRLKCVMTGEGEKVLVFE
jgi:hypothetical protein